MKFSCSSRNGDAIIGQPGLVFTMCVSWYLIVLQYLPSCGDVAQRKPGLRLSSVFAMWLIVNISSATGLSPLSFMRQEEYFLAQGAMVLLG